MTNAEKEARAQVVKAAIEEMKKSANFRCLEKCCGNCSFLDDDYQDFCASTMFCSNPKNEWCDAQPGEEVTWEIRSPSSCVCDFWEKKVSMW